MTTRTVTEYAEATTLVAFFEGCIDAPAVKERYKKLSKELHPDVCKDPRATDAFSNLVKMYDSAVAELDSGVWTGYKPNTVSFKTMNSTWSVSFKKKRVGDRGLELITTKGLLRVLSDEVVADRMCKIVTDVHNVLDKKVLEQVSGHLPRLAFKAINTIDDKMIVIIERNPSSASIEDLIDKWGPMDPKSVAWIMGSLLNFCCFLQTQKIVHCGITPQNVFLDTTNHVAQVVGGWEFYLPRGSKLTELPNWVMRSVPNSTIKDKTAKHSIDVESIKAIGRHCTRGRKDVPRAMDIWMSISAGEDAIEEYAKWESVRDTSFGMKRFVDFGNKAIDAYKES